MMNWKPDNDGVIRLRTRTEILDAYRDPALLTVGGHDRPGDLLGEFVFAPGKEPAKEPTKEKPELFVKSEPQKKGRKFDV